MQHNTIKYTVVASQDGGNRFICMQLLLAAWYTVYLCHNLNTITYLAYPIILMQSWMKLYR